LIRLTYFDSPDIERFVRHGDGSWEAVSTEGVVFRVRGGELPAIPPRGEEVSLHLVANALEQLAELFSMSARLGDGSRSWSATVTSHTITIVRIEMRSPLIVEVLLRAAEAVPAVAALVTILSGLVIAPVKVTRRWKEELLRIERIDGEREDFRAGRANALAETLRRDHPYAAPSQVEILDPDDDSRELDDLPGTGLLE
jgi:hypothetical protein